MEIIGFLLMQYLEFLSLFLVLLISISVIITIGNLLKEAMDNKDNEFVWYLFCFGNYIFIAYKLSLTELGQQDWFLLIFFFILPIIVFGSLEIIKRIITKILKRQ